MRGFVTNIENDTLENQDFRRVLYTAKNTQLVLMSLRANEEIGEEIHDLDQFIRVEAGQRTCTHRRRRASTVRWLRSYHSRRHQAQRDQCFRHRRAETLHTLLAARASRRDSSQDQERCARARGTFRRQNNRIGDVMKVHWLTDADAALAEAKTQKKPVLIDFSAAPA
jgi:hypothetical protein